MDRVATITVLVENRAGQEAVLAEHGLAVWVRYDDKHVLFDTGQGMAIRHNAVALGVPLDETDALVLSHGHYDHTGGASAVISASPNATVFAHPDAFQTRFACAPGQEPREVGMPACAQDAITRQAAALITNDQPAKVFEGLYFTGQIPRVTSYEDTGGPFFVDREGALADALLDDQAMYFDTPQGTVVLLGCAHAGVINTLHYVHELTGRRPIHAVLGGMHLGQASGQRLRRTIDALRALDVGLIGPAHCTGAVATAELYNAFPDQYVPFSVGSEMRFPLN